MQSDDNEEVINLDNNIFSHYNELVPDGAKLILDLSADWLDQGTRIYFACGAVNYIFDMIKTAILTNPAYIVFNNAFGWLWNYYDALAGWISAIKNSGKYDATTYRKTEKMAWAHLDNFMSTQLVGTTTLTLLATHGVLHGALLVGICLSLAAFGFAACMWASFTKACVKLHRSRMSLDPICYMEDRIKRYQNISNKLENIPKGYALSKELKNKLNDKKSRLTQQILMLTKIYPNNSNFNKNITDFFNLSDFTKLNKIFSENQISEKYPLIMEYLKKEQKMRVLKDSVSVGAWGLAAVGMTLIALGFFFPLLMLPGMIIASVAGAVKLVEVLVPVVSNAIALAKTENAIIQKYRDDLEKNTPDACTSVRSNMAYDLSSASQNKTIDRNGFFTKLTTLKEKSPFGAGIYLRNAKKKYLETRMLADALGYDNEKFNSELMGKIKNLNLSEKDKKDICQKYALTQSGMGLFDQKKSVSTNDDLFHNTKYDLFEKIKI